jgi:HPt (histidine-containing phosphotransfer) domain-containing protein
MRSEAVAFSLGEAQSETFRRPSARPVDLVHLSRYTLGDREIECEVLGLFANQAAIYLDRLAQAADDAEWREAAHSLKGSAKAVGAWRTAEAAERAEAAAGLSTLERAARLAEIEAALREAEAYICTLLTDR